MNGLQNEYVTVKFMYEQVRRQISGEMTQYADLLNSGTDEDIERYTDLEMAIEDKYQYRALGERLHNSENALLDWGKMTMLKLHPEQTETITIAIDKGRRHLIHREELLDTLSRLAA